MTHRYDYLQIAIYLHVVAMMLLLLLQKCFFSVFLLLAWTIYFSRWFNLKRWINFKTMSRHILQNWNYMNKVEIEFDEWIGAVWKYFALSIVRWCCCQQTFALTFKLFRWNRVKMRLQVVNISIRRGENSYFIRQKGRFWWKKKLQTIFFASMQQLKLLNFQWFLNLIIFCEFWFEWNSLFPVYSTWVQVPVPVFHHIHLTHWSNEINRSNSICLHFTLKKNWKTNWRMI